MHVGIHVELGKAGGLQRILFAADVKPAGPSKVSLCSHAESLFGRVQRLQLAIRSPITVQLSLTLWRCTTCCEIPEQDLLEPRVEIDSNCGLWSGWRTVELRLETMWDLVELAVSSIDRCG
jgi:hypothetical protein